MTIGNDPKAFEFILLANTAIDHTFGEINPMTKKDDYKLDADGEPRQPRGDCGRQRPPARPCGKWLNLADRAHEVQQRKERHQGAPREHPLLRRQLGPERREAG